MMQKYKFLGRVHQVLPLQTFPSGFAKRTLVVEADVADGKWRDFAAFEFAKGSKPGAQDRTAPLGMLHEGDEVEVTFVPEARENPKKAGQWFTSNRGLDLRVVAGQGGTADAPAPEPAPSPADDGDLPF